MKTLALAALLLAIVCLGGCAGIKQTGELYEMKTGRVSNLSVDGGGSVSGTLHGALPDGVRCDGNFNLVTAENAREMTVPEIFLSENAESGIAILRCTTGTVLRCTVAGSAQRGLSYGACKDQGGQEYALLF